MQEEWIRILLYVNFLLVIFLYGYVQRFRKLVGFQLGMNISIIAGGQTALSAGILLITLYPFSYSSITIITTLIGMLIGGLFGSLFDYQTFITGYANGLMMGIMAPMVGALIENDLTILIFIEVLLITSLLLIAIAIRKP